MATTFEWVAPAAIVTYLSTGLNSLADGSSVQGAAIALETGSPGLYPWMWLEVVLASLSPAAGAYVDIFAEYTLDGTNYSDAGKLSTQVGKLIYTFQLDTTATTAQRLVTSRPILVSPLDVKLEIRNKSGVAFGSSGNTLKYRLGYDQGV